MQLDPNMGNGNSSVSGSGPRVAIVHYWLLGYGGGERVISALLELFPQADLFALVANEEMCARFAPHRVTTSFLQHVPGSHRYHRHMLPLCPIALEQFDLRGYDLVISSESGPAKGVITSSGTVHVSYCHSPMRYIWDLYHEYTNGRDMKSPTRFIFKVVAHYMRMWDLASAFRVDHFIANSNNTAARIRKNYRRDAPVIHPPVDVTPGYVADSVGDYYLAVSRLVDYKRMDLAVEACTRLRRSLHVVGIGSQYRRLKELAGPTVEFLGELTEPQKNEQYAHCRALLFPGEEDFGMVPVEAHSFGRPVIAYGRGGALETVVGFYPGEAVSAENYTGVFFSDQSVGSLTEAIRAFEAVEGRFSSALMRANAERFDPAHFRRAMAAFISDRLGEFRASSPGVELQPVGERH
jgi:glycosyltransferase involved in cell wall biosynthesis